MFELYQARKDYGEAFVTVFPGGLVVPWKALSIQDYLQYDKDIKRGLIPEALFENEIFRKCVLNDTLVRQLDFLKAGTVTTVCMHIWQHSGPIGLDAFNDDLDAAREMLVAPGAKALHELIDVILSVFPYKPEEVYAMDYQTLLFRAVQAELKMLKAGHIKEPIRFIQKDDSQEKPNQARIPFADLNTEEEASEPKIDAKALWDKQQNTGQPIRNDRWWDESPVLEADKKHRINFSGDRVAADETFLDSHDLLEPPEVRQWILEQKTDGSRAKMIEDVSWIYPDLVDKLPESK